MALTFEQAVTSVDTAWNAATGAGRETQFREAGIALAATGIVQDLWMDILVGTSIRSIYHVDVMEAAAAASTGGTGGTGGTTTPTTVMKVYSTFAGEDIVDNLTRRVTAGLWTGNTGSLESFYTSSQQSGSTGDWYWNVYNLDPELSASAEVQFAVSYGQKYVCWFPSIAVLNTSKEPTKATYAQYRNILLDPEDETFTFGGSVNSDAIYIINVQRARLKQKIDAGNWELHLNDGVDTVKLIDDSGQKFDQTTSVAGRKFNVVSGSLNIGSTSTIKTPAASQAGGGYGLFYPDRGLIILNPGSVTASLANLAATYYTESDTTLIGDNHGAFFSVVVGGGNFTARNEEIVTSTHYFVRVKNRDYNLSNNPTYYTSSDGSLKVPTFVGDPHSYMTSIGLYNPNNELLAVAKLSQPILKSFDREALIKIKLDF